MIDFKALSAPFNPDEVSWRIGSMKKDKTAGMALAYIDARVVMDRLDEVCGPAGWQCKYSHANGKTVCDIGINVHGSSQQVMRPESDGSIIVDRLWVWKADGAGDSDIEAEKGALSDAFKRAAVRWGIGRYLYELPSPWVEVDEWKRIKPSEYKKLGQILREHTRAILDPAPKAPGTTRPEEFALEARKDGLTTETRATYDIAAEKKARVWVDTAKEAVRFATEARALDEWLDENSKAIDRLEAKYPTMHVDLMKAVGEVRETLQARAAA